jgi:glycosyltransferase involved in cell wall biosynthesis
MTKIHQSKTEPIADGAFPNGWRVLADGVLGRPLAIPVPSETGSRKGRSVRLMIAAFSARYALAQLLDELFHALSYRLDCRVLVPTNYSGKIPEQSLIRTPCGVSKTGGVFASINPVAHWKALSALLRSKPDVVHILSGEGYLWAITLAVAARLTGAAVVVTLHDPDPHPGNIFERLNSIVRRPVLALARTVHVFSSQHLDRAQKLAPRAQCVAIAHGSLAGQFLKHRKCGVKTEQLVLFFGRIQHYKGIDVLLQAMSALPPTIRLAIAGPGTLDMYAQQMVRDLGSRVELHNKYLEDTEVAALMQRAGAVALPYRHATQSSIPAIAAAFGCSLVATALGHFVEEIPQLGGAIVPPEDPGALAAALAKALAIRPVAQIGSPTFDDLAASFVNLYQSSARQFPPPSRPAKQGPSQ